MTKLADAIARNELTVTAQFVPFSQSRNKDQSERSLNWRITLQRKERDILTTDYSAGIGHCPAYKANIREAGGPNSMLRAEAIKLETETGRAVKFSPAGIAMMQNGPKIELDVTDVIYSLVMDATVLDYGTFEEWAESFGYETDSRAAESIYRACLETALKLRNGLGEQILAELNEAAQDY